MKFPNLKFISSLTLVRLSIAAIIVAGTAAISFGQKSEFAPSVNLDQCENGAIGTPKLPCTWVNGNLNRNNSQWKEGESVPYRLTMSGLEPGLSYTVVLGYDTTEGGIHTLDYLTTVDRSNVANPCLGVAGCVGPFTQIGIPVDPRVAAGPDGISGNLDDIVPIPGDFRMYGGILTAVGSYTYSGTFAGNSQAFIEVTFTAGPTGTAVLAWSGHIASRFDWGFDNAAVQLTGSPYHMRTAGGSVGGGNQDRSMKIDAVVFPALIFIRKEVSYLINGVQQTTAPTSFTFTTTGFPLPTPWDAGNFFQLTDDRVGSGPIASSCDSNLETPAGVNDFICIKIEDEAQFGVPLTVTESSLPNPWQLLDLTCGIDDGGNNTTGTVDPNGTANQATATITLQEANIAACLYRNTITTITAAPASISGRVTTAVGTGIGQVLVSVMNLETGEITYAYTNSFGNYSVEGLQVEQIYQVSVWNRKMSFGEGQRIVSLNGDLFGVDFVAESR